MDGVKTDCFAYRIRVDSVGRLRDCCEALNALYCKVEECKFYKEAERACKECNYIDCKGCAGERTA